MKKILKSFIYISILMIGLLAGKTIVLAGEYVTKFDEMFHLGEITINTNETIGETDQDLAIALYRHLSHYDIVESSTSSGDYTVLNLQVESCVYETKTCTIKLNRTTYVDWQPTAQEIKQYEDITININTNVSNYFDFVDNDEVVINYDETMFASENEKNMYISNFFNYKSTTANGINTSYSYDKNTKILTRIDYTATTGETHLVAKIVVNTITFENVETDYSDDFKILTSGNLTVKMNESGTITKDILSRLLSAYFNSEYYFTVDGNIVNNKVFIQLNRYGNSEKEKHLITLIKDTDIDLDIYEKYGIKTSFDMNISNSDQVYNYTNALKRNFVNNDRTTKNFDFIFEEEKENVYIQYIKRNQNYEIMDIQYYRLPVVLKGDSNEFSSEYTKGIGNKIVINSDVTEEEYISNAIGYKYNLIGCNESYTKCMIGYPDEESLTMEVHEIDIEFNAAMSKEFKKVFNVKEDNSIDILIDDVIQYSSLPYYIYDPNTGNNLEYKKDNENWILTMSNYNENKFETHTVTVNELNSVPTKDFISKIGINKDIYVGEKIIDWSNTGDFNFSKTKYSYTQPRSCDEISKTCVVYIYNENKNLEIHNVSVNIKTEKSEEYKAVIPNTSLSLNAVYKDDNEYLYMVSMAYLMSKTKNYAYMSNYANGKAQLTLDGLETHTIDVTFAEENTEHKAIIDEINQRLSSTDINILSTDVEFINSFYYDGRRGTSIKNFNSKAFNDEVSRIINNKRVGFFMVPDGAMGDTYTSAGGAKIVLYYDGIAYAVTNRHFMIKNSNVIYIPDDTEESIEAYVVAAQKRIDDYLGENSGVKIRFNANIGKEVFVEQKEYLEPHGIDVNKLDGNDYKISYNGDEDSVLIIKDSSKIQTATFVATDVSNNIIVSSETASYPTNTIVSSDITDEESEEYKNFLKQYGIKNAQIVNIDLYSPSIGDIKDFENQEFEVEVPLKGTGLDDEDLTAVYIKDNGDIEQHDITTSDTMAKFTTDHFSEYVIIRKSDVKLLKQSLESINPKTGDNIIYYITGLVISLIAIIFIIYSKSRKKK